MIEVTWQQEYEGTKMSYVWALLFGPLYFLYHRFWVEMLVTAITFPFGNLIALFIVRGSWKRRARAAADSRNMRTLMQTVVITLEANQPRMLSRKDMAELGLLEESM